MLEDNQNLPEVSTKQDDKNLIEEINDNVSLLPVSEEELVKNIIEANDKDNLQKQFDLFNMSQSKKNALRVIKLNSLLDKIEDQAIERFEKRPDQVSNKELLEYMQVVSTQIDKSQANVNMLSDKPMIKITNQTNEVNVNLGTELDRDGKEHVVDAIKALLKQVNNIDQNNITDIDNPEAYIEDMDNQTSYNQDDVLNSEDVEDASDEN